MPQNHTDKPATPGPKAPPARVLLAALGIFFVALGALGAALPLLPTTPFLLLAAWCFARSSGRLHNWLLQNRLFGEYLRRYRGGEGLPLSVKITTISTLWLALGASALWAWPEKAWLLPALLLIGAAVTAHIALIKPRPPQTGRTGQKPEEFRSP